LPINNNKKYFKSLLSNHKIRTEIVATVSTPSTLSKAPIYNNKKTRDGRIVSPSNYTLKTNITISNNVQNENEYKNINDLVEYINSSDNAKQKKNNNKKKRNNKKIKIIITLMLRLVVRTLFRRQRVT